MCIGAECVAAHLVIESQVWQTRWQKSIGLKINCALACH